MKILIAEDDPTSRLILHQFLKAYGQCDLATNGDEAALAAYRALQAGEPYDLICLDIMMPEMDGRAALQEIRDHERARGIVPPQGSKIVMTTALDDVGNIMSSFSDECDAYVVKPIKKTKLVEELRRLELIR